MFSITRKTHKNFPGLRHKIKDGVFRGKIYTAFPLRIRIAFFQILKPCLVGFLLAVAFLPETDATYELVASVIIIAFVFVYPAYILFDPGKRIEITPEFFYIGFSKFRLREISNFSVEQSYNKEDHYIITFKHGSKLPRKLICNTSRPLKDFAGKDTLPSQSLRVATKSCSVLLKM